MARRGTVACLVRTWRCCWAVWLQSRGSYLTNTSPLVWDAYLKLGKTLSLCAVCIVDCGNWAPTEYLDCSFAFKKIFPKISSQITEPLNLSMCELLNKSRMKRCSMWRKWGLRVALCSQQQRALDFLLFAGTVVHGCSSP